MVATEHGQFVELQGSGEEATFSQSELDAMLTLGANAIRELIAAQREVLGNLAVQQV
jgi:ribonuclease PH